MNLVADLLADLLIFINAGQNYFWGDGGIDGDSY